MIATWIAEEAERKAKNREICDSGAAQVVSRKYEGIHVLCYNHAEAQEVKDYMQSKYPDVPLRVSWIDFGIPRELIKGAH